MRINRKKKKKNEKMQIAKKRQNKQKYKGKESFFQVDVMCGYRPVVYRTLCQQLAHVTQAFFLNSLKHVLPLINITEIVTLRSSSLEPLSKYTCIRLSQKRAERQKINFGKYLKQKPNLPYSSFKYKTVSFQIYQGIKVVTKKEFNPPIALVIQRLNRRENLAQKSCQSRT